MKKNILREDLENTKSLPSSDNIKQMGEDIEFFNDEPTVNAIIDYLKIKKSIY